MSKKTLILLVCLWSVLHAQDMPINSETQSLSDLEAKESVDSEAKGAVPSLDSYSEELKIEGKIKQQQLKKQVLGSELDNSPSFLNKYGQLKKQAQEGDVEAQMKMAMIFLKGEKGVQADPKTALKWYQKAAAQGNFLAFYAIGQCYEVGKGVSQDMTKAFQWYQKAAENIKEAALKAGEMAEKGVGVLQDFKLAKSLYKGWALQGDAEALFRLGKLYYYGEGVEQNLVKSYVFFAKAAAQGHQKGLQMRELTSQSMRSSELLNAKKEALKPLTASDI